MGVKTFPELIQEQKINGSNGLPLIHTTTERPLFNILKYELIKSPEKCKEYGEDLVYFFYGKPAYYAETELANFTINPPVCLLYDLNNIPKDSITRILPFDSGGIKRYGFKKYNREDFTISQPGENTCSQILELIFTTKENYLNNIWNQHSLKAHAKECWMLEDLINAYNAMQSGGINTGPQLLSIEVQVKEKVDFPPSKLLIPYSFCISGKSEVLLELKNKFSNLEIIFYAKNETIANPGVPLQGTEYYRLLKEEVLNQI